MSVLLWFKNDLRLVDNAALHQALQLGRPIIPVYCIDPNHFKEGAFGFKRTGSFRAQFLLESLRDLDQALRQLGSGLIVKFSAAGQAIPDLVREYGASTIVTSSEVGYEELQTIEAVRKQVQDGQIITTEISTLLDAEDYPFLKRDVPDVFTRFRQMVEKQWKVRDLYPSVTSINSPSIPPMQLPGLQDLGLENVTADKRASLQFKGGTTEAFRRLKYYFEETQLVSTYKVTRNGMVGGDYSSKFSAWLAMGCISARSIYHALKDYEQQYGANESTYWLVFELLWRDYFKWMMLQHPRAFFLKKGLGKYPIQLPPLHAENFNKWVNGQTDNAFINANMIELKLSGFMSNRGRQNVASYLCHHLQCDWRYGAAYFEELLVDYDVSSNWCNWAYLAGVGNDPIKGRVFNPVKQANQYDADGVFRKLWL